MIWLLVPAAWALDLDDVRAQATERAVAVERAAAASRAARGVTLQTLSGTLPDVGLFGTVSTGAGLTSFGFQRPTTSQFGVGITGSWTLLTPATWAATDAARHSARGSRALVDWARVSARRDATLAVAELVGAERSLAAWTAAAADAERAATAVDSLVSSGLRPAADAARVRATASALRAEAIEAEGELAGACASMKVLLREPVTGACTLDPVSIPDPQTSDATHPALVAATEAARAARAARTGAWLDRGPTVQASGTVAQYVTANEAGPGWNVGVDARLPLISGGAGAGAIQSAGAGVDDAELALEQQERTLDAAKVAAEARFRAARSGLEARNASMAAADKALELVDGRYREGLASLEAWLDARRTRDEAAVALAAADAAMLAALAELESVRGIW